MRMWMVDPEIMCQKHLLGEHVELHMLVGSINLGIDLSGYKNNGLMEATAIQSRHDELVIEMIHRGMNHKSPMHFEYNPLGDYGQVDKVKSLHELTRRCTECRARMHLKSQRTKEQ